jgi:hypothetical protein
MLPPDRGGATIKPCDGGYLYLEKANQMMSELSFLMSGALNCPPAVIAREQRHAVHLASVPLRGIPQTDVATVTGDSAKAASPFQTLSRHRDDCHSFDKPTLDFPKLVRSSAPNLRLFEDRLFPRPSVPLSPNSTPVVIAQRNLGAPDARPAGTVEWPAPVGLH